MMEKIDAAVQTLNNTWIDDAKRAGGKVLGFFCSYVPEEILNLNGLSGFRMRATGSEDSQNADNYLGSFNCGYTRHCLEMGLAEKYDFLDGFVFTSCCGHLSRLCDNWQYFLKPDFSYILDAPHLTDDDALRWYRDALEKLCMAITSHFGIPFEQSMLWQSIKETNITRHLLMAIDALRTADKLKLTGEEMHKICIFAASVPKITANKVLKEILDEYKNKLLDKKYRARIFLIGSHLDDHGLIELMEETGALVVADSFCGGIRDQMDDVQEDNIEDPFMALAMRYINRITCPCMYGEYSNRFDTLLNMVRDSKVDGVIIQHMKFCEIWGVDSNMMYRNFKDQGIHVLRLEHAYRQSSTGQLRTRIQAFIESMGK